MSYELPVAVDVQLAVYDATGHLVRLLFHGRQPAGSHSVPWNGRDEQGTSAAAGVYFYRLQAGATVLTRKIVLMN